jgi:hypothetical protein
VRPKKEESDDEFILNKKRKNGIVFIYNLELASDILEMESRIKKSKTNKNDDDDNIQDNTNKEDSDKKHSGNHINSNHASAKKNIIIQSGNQKISLLTDSDIEKFKNIDQVIESFTTMLKDISRERVLDALVFNSFNIEKTYEFLTNQDFEKSKKQFFKIDCVFSDVDDYIIKYHKSEGVYNNLVYRKGVEEVNNRERYLKLNK